MVRFNEIKASTRGWSDLRHAAFFKTLLEQLPFVTDILIAGVYNGRDISLLLDMAARYHAGRSLRIVGVDKFSDTPCDDWAPTARNLSWEQAGFGPAPTRQNAWNAILRATKQNWEDVIPSSTFARRGPLSFELIEANDADYVARTDLKFDVIYWDTSHDYETVRRQLGQVRRIARDSALICGDDYSDQSNAGGSWGVKRAVSEAFTFHQVFASWIWFAPLSALKS